MFTSVRAADRPAVYGVSLLCRTTCFGRNSEVFLISVVCGVWLLQNIRSKTDAFPASYRVAVPIVSHQSKVVVLGCKGVCAREWHFLSSVPSGREWLRNAEKWGKVANRGGSEASSCRESNSAMLRQEEMIVSLSRIGPAG